MPAVNTAKKNVSATARATPAAPRRIDSFAKLLSRNVFRKAASDSEYQIDKAFLRELLEISIERIAVDADWYLETYPDVQASIARGDLESAEEHYRGWGYFEHRLPHPIQVDSQWYLARNKDVAEAITEGLCESAQRHFVDEGFREGRLPFEKFELILK